MSDLLHPIGGTDRFLVGGDNVMRLHTAEEFSSMLYMEYVGEAPLQKAMMAMNSNFSRLYIDIFHLDVFAFLSNELPLKGVCIPDLFMRQVEADGSFFIFDLRQIKEVMGFSLPDVYDEKEIGAFHEKYDACVQHPIIRKVEVSAVSLMKHLLQCQIASGGPAFFYRDSANRLCGNQCKETLRFPEQHWLNGSFKQRILPRRISLREEDLLRDHLNAWRLGIQMTKCSWERT